MCSTSLIMTSAYYVVLLMTPSCLCRSPSSSFHSAGQRLTPHSRTLEIRPGRINKKLELQYAYVVKGMILNYYSVSQIYDLVLLGDRLDKV